MLQNRLLVCVFELRGMRIRRRGYLRGYRVALYMGPKDFPRSACLFDPKFTPALRTNLAGVSAANSPAVDTDRFSEVIPEAGNGTSPIARDIADIALQQLLDREVQDS